MQLYTYRARSLAEAMKIVRAELGPDASVLHTRVIGSAALGLLGGQTLEVTASDDADVPSRLPQNLPPRAKSEIPAAELSDYRRLMRQNLRASGAMETSLVEQLAKQPNPDEISSRFPALGGTKLGRYVPTNTHVQTY